MAEFNQAALPHDFPGYRDEAASMSREEFMARRPYPFLVFARSTLWDRSLLGRPQDDDDRTAMVEYNMDMGGRAFLSPIRKVDSESGDSAISLGRSRSNDIMLPITSVSARHGKFESAGEGPDDVWRFTDLHSTNGTFLGEDPMPPGQAVVVPEGSYLRLGGNLLAWFVLPGELWARLRDPAALAQLTDL